MHYRLPAPDEERQPAPEDDWGRQRELNPRPHSGREQALHRHGGHKSRNHQCEHRHGKGNADPEPLRHIGQVRISLFGGDLPKLKRHAADRAGARGIAHDLRVHRACEFVRLGGAETVDFSSVMPHFGQLPGPTCLISGCMDTCIRLAARTSHASGREMNSDYSARSFLVLPGTLRYSPGCRSRKYCLDKQRSPRLLKDRPPFRKRDRGLDRETPGDYDRVPSSNYTSIVKPCFCATALINRENVL